MSIDASGPYTESCPLSFDMQEAQKWGVEKEEDEGRVVHYIKPLMYYGACLAPTTS